MAQHSFLLGFKKIIPVGRGFRPPLNKQARWWIEASGVNHRVSLNIRGFMEWNDIMEQQLVQSIGSPVVHGFELRLSLAYF